MIQTDTEARVVTRHPHLRQFGLREAAAFTTCLAITLAIYRHSQYGLLNACLVTVAATLLAWHTKAWQQDRAVPVGYQYGMLAMVTLLGEMGLAWLTGYFADSFLTLWMFVGCLRMVMLLYGLQLFVVMPVIAALRLIQPRIKLPHRVGWITLAIFTMLSVPYALAAPLYDGGRLSATRAVGGEAIVRDCLKYQMIRAGRIVRTKEFPALVRLGIEDCVRLRQGFELKNYVHETRYEVLRYDDTRWRVIVHTYTRGSVVLGDWPEPDL